MSEEKFEFNVINRPKHYADRNIEVIDFIQDSLTPEQFEGYCIGNVLKYVSRYRLKNGVEDLEKARYYLNKIIIDMKVLGE